MQRMQGLHNHRCHCGFQISSSHLRLQSARRHIPSTITNAATSPQSPSSSERDAGARNGNAAALNEHSKTHIGSNGSAQTQAANTRTPSRAVSGTVQPAKPATSQMAAVPPIKYAHKHNGASSSKETGPRKPATAVADIPTKRTDKNSPGLSPSAIRPAKSGPHADANSAGPGQTDTPTVGIETSLLLPAAVIAEHGKPSFIIPSVPGFPPDRQVAHLPLMLYIPGIDGTGMAASRQFPTLMGSFDFRAFSVPQSDRTPFTGLVDAINSYLEAEVDVNDPDRPVYLLGESFGAVLALAVASAKTDLVDRLVLINPATSYEASIWPRLGPALAKLPDAAYNAIPYALSPVLGNPLALAGVNVDRSASFTTQAAQYAEGLQKLIPQLGYLAKILPPAVLQWKLELLKQGNQVVKPLLAHIQQRVLLLTADNDLLIPSKQEGPRLRQLLPRCRHKEFKGASHALLQEADIDLAQLMKQLGFYVSQRHMSAPVKKRGKSTFGSAAPIEKPTLGELDYYSEGALNNLKTLQSPVFLSTAEDGTVQQGCGAIPLDRPLLLVSNHQTYALDIGPLIEGLLRQTGLLPRGLTHPAVFQGNLEERKDNADPRSNVFGSLLTTFGSVEVGGRNFFKLMQNGECVLLYPGGVREAYKMRGEEYKLFWPKQPEFVRMAARFGATIVPFGGVGLDDGFEMILDPSEIRAIPVLGKWLEDNAKNKIPPARRGTSQKSDMEELFIQPLPLPKLPQRLYFKFQQPIRTCPEDAKDPARAQQIYDQTKKSCEDAISYLRINREKDPYKDLLPRLFYERSWGGKQAPTFPLE